MNFNFRVWPFDEGTKRARWQASAADRPALVAKWQRASDGHLESRWQRETRKGR